MILKTGRYFVAGNGKENRIGVCADIATVTAPVNARYSFPSLGKNLVLTKAWSTKVHEGVSYSKTANDVGVFMFKRLVTHTCIGKKEVSKGGCKKGTIVAGVPPPPPVPSLFNLSTCALDLLRIL